MNDNDLKDRIRGIAKRYTIDSVEESHLIHAIAYLASELTAAHQREKEELTKYTFSLMAELKFEISKTIAAEKDADQLRSAALEIAAIDKEQGCINLRRAETAESKLAEKEHWKFCPECGSGELHHEEGTHKQCARCHQEWFADSDYTKVVQINLGKRMELKEQLELRTKFPLEKEITAERDALRKQVEENLSELESLRAQRDGYYGDVVKAAEELESLKADRERLERATKLEQNIASLANQEIAKLRAELESLNTAKPSPTFSDGSPIFPQRTSQYEIDRLRTELSETKQRLEEATQLLEQSANESFDWFALKGANDTLSLELEEAKGQIERLIRNSAKENELSECCARLLAAEAHIVKLEKENEELRAKIK